MSKTTKNKLAEWYVQLNAWIWPEDFECKPDHPGGLTASEERLTIRGALAGLDASGAVDMRLVYAIWWDEDRCNALIHPATHGDKP